MARKKTSERLAPQKTKPAEQSLVKSTVAGFYFDLAIFVVISILGLAAISFSGAQRTSIEKTSREKLTKNNFAHLSLVQKWSEQNLEAYYQEQVFDLNSKLANWRDISYFSAAEQPELTPSRWHKNLNSLVLDGLHVQNPWAAFSDTTRVLGFNLNNNRIYFDLSQEIAPQINQEHQDAVLKIENGRAVEFTPHKIGRNLNTVGAIAGIRRALFENRSDVELSVVTTKPKILLGSLNSLGIKELVTRGESDFSGSSGSRITNIRVGSQKFNGIILKPGEEFSFNTNLGPVSADAGFKPELVIKSSGTVPELGGGLCQVSTTAFRAALYGGLPITARRNHSYAVSYYAPQGTDATIYPGVVDFKFVNDTSGHLLIWTHMEGSKLYFEYYGTKDDRQVVIDGPYQYDFGPGGAMKARLSRVVTKNGDELEDDFYSKYVSKDLFPHVYEYPENNPPTATEQPTNDVPAPDTENNSEQTTDTTTLLPEETIN